ncbi:hypothetical protein BGW80DRAFT_191267 [Lactifluus volemus]|nr:hypothetical protein BGW80DRAFT_191267 [Lactifluus volemus]
MYNVTKVVTLVKQFSSLCQRYGLYDEENLHKDFVFILKEVESEFERLAQLLSQCRGKTKFEQFKKGLSRSNMTKEIQKCDRQMTRIFDRFTAAMLVDIRFQQLFAERAQSTPIPTSVHQMPISSSPVLSFSRPVRPQIFFGRDAELKTIVDLILFSSASSPPARIAILGPAGVGKTSLAHAVLTHDRIVSRFGGSDSRYLIPCESLKSRESLLVALANSLSLLRPPEMMSSDDHCSASVLGLESHVVSALSSKTCILCLDNFESPWDQPEAGRRRAVEHLLAEITAIPSVTVLITMRGGERPKGTAWTLPMFPPLTNFGYDAARRTWESLAGSHDEWAEKLIHAVDRLPLAVTLLASLAEVSGAETLWERWQRENITSVEKEKGDKLSSLEFSIALSLDSARMVADPSSRRLLGILGLLPDGMPVSPSSDFQRLFHDILDISRSLDTLLKCSLAIRTADKRVQVNSLVRLYCEKHTLIAPEDREALRDYYVTLASHGYDSLDHDLFQGMTMEMNNMESVLQMSLTWTPLTAMTPVIEAIIAFTQFCSYVGNFSDVTIKRAIQVQGLSDETQGDCLTSLGSVYFDGNKVDLAQKCFENALQLHQNAEDVIGQANDHCHLGDVFYRCDKVEEAKTHYQRAYDFNVHAQSACGQANALTHLGDTYRTLGDLEESRSHYQRSLALHKENGDRLGQANSLKGLGYVYLRMDDMKLAKDCFERALDLHKIVNDLVGQANDISSLADVHRRLDNLAAAEEAYHEALRLHNRAKDDLGRGNALSHLGDLYRKRDKLQEAKEYYLDALRCHEKASDKLGQANDLKGLGGISHKQGDMLMARSQYYDALKLYEATNNSLGRANCQKSLGHIYYSQQKINEAAEMFQSALENYKRASDSVGQGNALNDLGDVERRRESYHEAEQLYFQALQAHLKADDKVGQGNGYKGLGIVYEKQNKLEQAKEMFEKARDMHRWSGKAKSERRDEVHINRVIRKLSY